RAGSRIGEDAAGIVIDIRGDEARPYHGKKQQDPELPTSQKFHAHGLQRRSNWQNRTIRINAERAVWIGESAKLRKFSRRDAACCVSCRGARQGKPCLYNQGRNHDYSLERSIAITSSGVITPVS